MPAAGRAWLVATVTLTMSFGAVGAYSVGVLAPFILPALHLSAGEYSLIVAGVYTTAMITTARVGRLADRLPTAGSLVVLLLAAAASLAALSVAGGLLALVGAAAISGLALAASNPITNRAVVESFSAGGRGFVMGVKQSGVPGAAFAVGLALPPLAVALGWRHALLVTAVAPLLLIPGGWLALARGGAPAVRSQTSERTVTPILWRLTAYGLAMGAAGSFVNSFVALYAVRELGFSRPLAGAAVAAAGLAGVVSRVVWATAGDRWSTDRLLAYLAAASLAAAALGALSTQAGGWLLWPAVVGLGATALAWNGVGMLALIKDAPAASIGWSSGFMMRGFYLGLLLGPPLYGQLVDRTGGFATSWLAQVAIYAAALAVTLEWLRSRAAATAVARVPPAG